MKRNYVLFGVVLAMVLNVFTNSCRSDDEENAPLSKSKRIKEINLEWIHHIGGLYNFSTFLSYNAKSQLDKIFYTDKDGYGNNVLIDYYNGKIYQNEKELCTFKLNNKGYIEFIKTERNEYEYEYNAGGYLAKVKNKGKIYYDNDLFSDFIADIANYKYENDNLMMVERLELFDFDFETNKITNKIMSTLTFAYSDELNINNIPSILYSLGSTYAEGYFPINYDVSGGEDKSLVLLALHYVGLFGKASKNLCRYCGEKYYSNDIWAATYKNSYDENGNLTRITDLKTKNSYSWNFVY